MKPLQHKKHTLAKRGLSLLCVLALCLGLLPVTALAAENAPATLYVGNYQITNGNATTYLKAGSTQGSLVEGSENDWTVKYDPSTATLTLNEATITGNDNISSVLYGAGIYAQCNKGQPVTLTIELIGTNTITGHYGIHVNAHQTTSTGTDASLVIKNSGDNGSLTVTGTGDSGLLIASGTGNASLTINDVSVVASSRSSYSYAGVCVQSGATATGAPNISLSVDGGSLTASGTGSSGGIQFVVGNSSASATTSLTVTDQAIVDARNGGIKAYKDLTLIGTDISATGSSGGIVFDGSTGTVYGSVTLQDNLEIKSGETLTVPSGSSLNCNDKLTNNGTILASGGTVTGSLSGGTAVTTPTITTQPTGQTVTEGSAATFSVTASDAQTYQWQQSTDSGSNWTNIESATSAKYTTEATTTSMNNYQYRCVVKSASGVGVISDAATLTVNKGVSPTSYSISADVDPAGAGTVTVNDSTSPVSVAAGGTMTLTATANEGYRFTGWTSSGGGTFTDASSNSTTFTMPASDVTVTAQFAKVVTGVKLDKEALELYTGESATLTAAVQPSDATNQNVTWQSDNAIVATVNNGTVTAKGAGETTITVQTQDGNYTATCQVTVKSRPSYNPPTVSEKTIDAIRDAQPGDTVTVDLSRGSTKLDKEVFEELRGQDITLVIELGDGLSWTINGSDIPENAKLADIDLGVTMNSHGIPVDIINAITGERGSIQLELAHNGAFGFTMTLSAPLGTENAGYWANLYHFDEDTNKMSFETAAKINSDGTASLSFSHASQYAIVIDDHNHGVIELPFTDVNEGDWFYDPVCFVYENGLMTGTSADTFEPNTSLSRAMLVAVLHRLEGSPAASGSDFNDVASGDWYAEAVNWAASVGVVNGMGDGSFQPNAAITREQMAAILRNYAAYKGMDVTTSGDLSTYSDAASVSDWAKESMQWAVGQGLLSGMTIDTLQPQGLSTRAQVAAVLQRYLAN